ncbi:LysR substrate-binding domain-containing protein [Myroides injenensis]|uniref:LysR substrate-binding domain-containing protein n=1 Tax=Myroides injenensis TaxID=1183151 RepID=UPI0002895A9E|nr:LysR substrate-binding domain-containing protein [Myroides injenensis]
MELRQLKYFLKAKELLNFTEASKQLYITQSTLSQQIKQLEEEIGQPLFDRIGKRITLTEAGKMFATYAEKSINAANDGMLLLKDVRGLEAGVLRIGLTWGLKSIVLSSLKSFTQCYPKVKIEVTFGTTTELIQYTLKQEIDFALTFFEGEHREALNYRPLMTSDMALIVSNSSHLAILECVELKDVAKMRLALPVKGFSTRDFLDSQFKLHNINPNILVEVNQTSTVIDLVQIGAFETILTLATVHGESNIKAIPIMGVDIKREAVIITLKESYQKRAVEVFVNLLMEEDKNTYNQL